MNNSYTILGCSWNDETVDTFFMTSYLFMYLKLVALSAENIKIFGFGVCLKYLLM